jgi:ABC-type multidrug transport system fused ATPase/permease subunit
MISRNKERYDITNMVLTSIQSLYNMGKSNVKYSPVRSSITNSSAGIEDYDTGVTNVFHQNEMNIELTTDRLNCSDDIEVNLTSFEDDSNGLDENNDSFTIISNDDSLLEDLSISKDEVLEYNNDVSNRINDNFFELRSRKYSDDFIETTNLSRRSSSSESATVNSGLKSDERIVLQDVTIHVPRGELAVVIGMTGAGILIICDFECSSLSYI